MEKNLNKISWAAGLLEGEGCFYISKYKPKNCEFIQVSVKIICTMTDKDIIFKLRDIIGSGNIYSVEKNLYGKPAKTQWRYQLSKHEEILNFISKIYPYMGNRRKNKIDDIINILCNKLNKNILIDNRDLRDMSWVIGLLEGEGCFGIMKRNYKSGIKFYNKIECSMTDHDVVEKLKDILNFGSIKKYKRKDRPNNKEYSYWTCADSNKILPFLNEYINLFGERRKTKILEMLG